MPVALEQVTLEHGVKPPQEPISKFGVVVHDEPQPNVGVGQFDESMLVCGVDAELWAMSRIRGVIACTDEPGDDLVNTWIGRWKPANTSLVRLDKYCITCTTLMISPCKWYLTRRSAAFDKPSQYDGKYNTGENNFVRRQQLKYFGHVTRHNGLEKTKRQGMVAGKRSRGKPRQKWEKNITDLRLVR